MNGYHDDNREVCILIMTIDEHDMYTRGEERWGGRDAECHPLITWLYNTRDIARLGLRNNTNKGVVIGCSGWEGGQEEGEYQEERNARVV